MEYWLVNHPEGVIRVPCHVVRPPLYDSLLKRGSLSYFSFLDSVLYNLYDAFSLSSKSSLEEDVLDVWDYSLV
jgi:hypothetical protein